MIKKLIKLCLDQIEHKPTAGWSCAVNKNNKTVTTRLTKITVKTLTGLVPIVTNMDWND